MDADWDLQAVVRGCCSAVSTTATDSAPPDGYKQKSTFFGEDDIGIWTFSPDLFQTRNDNSIAQFMNDIYNLQDPPYHHHHHHQISPFSFLGGCQDPPYHHHNHRQQKPENQFQVKQESLGVSSCRTTHAQGTTKIKKRKNQIKTVCHVPADGSSPDLWSWRKYGQKPIKGSPYPRGYYKCSTLKGCSARKQVERNRSDPGMLIITYTGKHTHPVPAEVNSLVGNKTATTGDNITGNKPSPSSNISPASSLPPVPEKMDETEKYDTDDDNNFEVSGVVIDEDTFDGLDELGGSVVGDLFPDHQVALNPVPPFPWLSNYFTTTTTTAAGGS